MMAPVFSKAIAVLALLFASSVHAAVVSETEPVKNENGFGKVGTIRYHYDDSNKAQCESVIIVGVGTGMKVKGYDKLGKDMSENTGIVAVFVDFSSLPIKLDPSYSKKYAKAANAIADQLPSLIPACKKTPSKGIFVGGHSAGGQAAVEALTKKRFTFEAKGFLGLSPFDISSSKLDINIPAMLWGLSVKTCGVSPQKACIAAYEDSPKESRVYYQIQNPKDKGKQATHCVFTDEGCQGPICPSNPASADWVRPTVGQSMPIFVDAVHVGKFVPSKFNAVIGDKEVKLFVNEDSVVVAKVGQQQAQPAFA